MWQDQQQSFVCLFLSCEEADERGSRAPGPDRTLSRSATGGEALLISFNIVLLMIRCKSIFISVCASFHVGHHHVVFILITE